MYYILYVLILILLFYLYKKNNKIYIFIGMLVLTQSLTNIIYYKK